MGLIIGSCSHIYCSVTGRDSTVLPSTVLAVLLPNTTEGTVMFGHTLLGESVKWEDNGNYI